MDVESSSGGVKAGKKPKGNSFGSMELEQNILNGLNRMNYKAPTPVQRKALPIVLAGMDIVCMARTGSGKTCVFLLPLMQKLKAHDSSVGCRSIVLSPTRELAMQTFKFAKDMAKFTDLRIIAIVGGDPIEAQFEALSTRPDVIIATPGRLMHLLREIKTFKLKSVKYLVFDEADRLFEMGFAEQLNEITRECPEERQTLLFSATMPKQLIQFSRAGLKDPQLVRLDTDTKMSDELRQGFFSVRSNEKVAALLYLVRKIIPADHLSIVFTATRHHSEMLHYLFSKIGISSTLVYGTMDQEQRTANLRAFKNGEASYMIVTDVAARGIDVPLLNNVINFHFPSSPKLFVHRCGRAARQGRVGYAFSIVEPDELAFAMDVLTFLGKEVVTTHNPNGDFADGSSACGYKLEQMQPDFVHTGLFPQDVIDEENDFFKRILADDDSLLQLFKTSENGMMQYKRTRSEATREGVKKAKALVKDEVVKHIHPLIVGSDPDRCHAGVVEKAVFVRMLQNFRPAQTVFESGIGTGTSSTASKQAKKNGSKDSKGVVMMKALRKATASALERNKKNIDEIEKEEELLREKRELSSSNSEHLPADRLHELEMEIHDDDFDDFDDDDDDGETGSVLSMAESAAPPQRVRLSIAEKKKLKKKGLGHSEIAAIAAQKMAGKSSAMSDFVVSEAAEISGDFKDKRFYMTYGTENERATLEEDLLQPSSGLRSSERESANALNHAYLDVDPDDAVDVNRKKRVLRWDAKKRKFVKQSLEEMSAMGKGAKRMRTESGVSGKGSALPTGQMYEKWKKKSKREVNTMGTGDDYDDRPRPNVKVNRGVRDEVRSADDIRKLRKQGESRKLKNMDKDKRAQMQGKLKKKAASGKEGGRAMTKAGNSRKTKAVLRY